MKKIFATIALLLAVPALAGCAGLSTLMTGVPASPSVAANQTVLDDKAATLAEQSYQFAVALGETAIDAGLLKGDAARCVASIDRKAYSALQAVRSSYRAGNAQAYNVAVSDFKKAMDDFRAAVGGSLQC